MHELGGLTHTGSIAFHWLGTWRNQHASSIQPCDGGQRCCACCAEVAMSNMFPVCLQTKMKSVLVDFLVGAGLKPTSIVSYNHLGNNDGMNLSAPQTFRR